MLRTIALSLGFAALAAGSALADAPSEQLKQFRPGPQVAVADIEADAKAVQTSREMRNVTKGEARGKYGGQ